MTLTIHPVCEAMAEMTADEYSKLKDSIQSRGVDDAIWVLGTEILDGRHRYKACVELGIDCPTRAYAGDTSLLVHSTNAANPVVTILTQPVTDSYAPNEPQIRFLGDDSYEKGVVWAFGPGDSYSLNIMIGGKAEPGEGFGKQRRMLPGGHHRLSSPRPQIEDQRRQLYCLRSGSGNEHDGMSRAASRHRSPPRSD